MSVIVAQTTMRSKARVRHTDQLTTERTDDDGPQCRPSLLLGNVAWPGLMQTNW